MDILERRLMGKIFFEKKRVQISKKKGLFERWLTLVPDLD